MGVRTSTSLALKIGFDNSLNDLAVEREIKEVVDSLLYVNTDTGKLNAGETGKQISFGDVSKSQLIYVEAEAPMNVEFGGSDPTSAQVDGSGGTYPTSFAGGENLVFLLDSTSIVVTFEDGDENITDVINRINAACALAGFATPVASNNSSQLRLTSPTTGTGSTLVVSSGSALATLGLTSGVSSQGSNATQNTSVLSLKPLAVEGQVETLRSYALLTIETTALYLSNPDTSKSVRYLAVVAGY